MTTTTQPEGQPEAPEATVADTPPATGSPAVAAQANGRLARWDTGWRLTRSLRQRRGQAAAASKVLSTVERVRSWIPTWTRTVTAVLDEANKASDDAALKRVLEAAKEVRAPTAGWTLAAACSELSDLTKGSHGLGPRELVGEQAELLTVDLHEADAAWPHAHKANGKPDYAAVAADAQHALGALQGALQHALVLTFLNDSKGKRVGSRCEFDDYCLGWNLTDAERDAAWLWLTHDPWLFGGQPLPLVLDGTGKHRVYRKARTWYPLWFLTTLTPLWGAALVYGLVAALFAVLHQAGLTHWPHDWAVKLLILVLFVTLGAIAHLASRSLSAISYDDPLQVYAAGQALDWLSLRWLAILRDYIPILVVAVTLWGAGTIPTKFQDLATALLSGYSADSLFKAGLSKLQSQSTGSPGNSATTPTGGPQTPTGGPNTNPPPTAQHPVSAGAA